MDDWRRFANAQRQEQLIAMAEAIVASLKSEEEAGKTSDLAATARALRELHTKWQEVAEAPRHSAQRLWDRFRTATDFIRSRCETVLRTSCAKSAPATSRRRSRSSRKPKRWPQSNDWGKAAGRFQELQSRVAGSSARCRATTAASSRSGSAPRATRSSRAAARTSPAARRRGPTTSPRRKRSASAPRCWPQSTEWDAASSEIKRLQAEWKTVGPVRRNKSEVIWNRFRAAADKFFERYHNRHQIALAGKLAEREALVVELEGWRPPTAVSRRRISASASSSCARRGTAACRFPPWR